MRIGLLICDHFDPDLLGPAGGDYDVLYSRFLQEADPTVEVVPYDAINGHLPADPDECDGWVITGSRHDAFADTPWIEALRAFVRQVHERRSRLAGICFGHQVIAEALGGRVERAQQWKVGPQVLAMRDQPWFEGGEVAISAMHRDVVTRLPEGAEVIAEGTTAAVPAFRVGDHIFTVQDHPEYERGLVEGLVRARESVFGADVADEAMALLDGMETDGWRVGRWIVDFLRDRRAAAIEVESIQVGARSTVAVGERRVETGIIKKPVSEVEITHAGLAGDAVVDTKRHGGRDQAVYVYTREDYAWWEGQIGRPLPAGSFGENLTISRAGSAPVRVGDRLVIGEVMLEVTAPRNPCSVFAAVMDEPGWIQRFTDARRPGFYCRVLSPGRVECGDEVAWKAADDANATVVEMVGAQHDGTTPPDVLRRILGSPIAQRTRAQFEERLARA